MQNAFSWHSLLEWRFWFQPALYAAHGWLATEMAIWLLFHPYKPVFVPGTKIQLPLTPGVFPRGRKDLTRNIAETVTQTLLTEVDIHKQVERLLTEENLVKAIDALTESIQRELRNTEQLRHIYRYGEEVIPMAMSQMVNNLIDRLEEKPGRENPNRENPNLESPVEAGAEAAKPGKLQSTVSELLGNTLPGMRLNYHQAEFVTDALFNTLLTPPYIRTLVTDGLSDTNIMRIEKGVSRQVGGVKGLVIRLMGFDKTLEQLRDFFIEKPDEAEVQITDFIDRLEVREKLSERIAGFSFDDLPEDTRQALRGYGAALVTEMLVDHREEINAAVATWSGKASRLLINRMLQADPKRWLDEKYPDWKIELARFIRRYLGRELELMIGQALPAMEIGPMIIEKMNQFSNEELEQMILGLCRRELRWMAFLGAFLGFWLGLVSNLVNYLLP